MMDTRLLRDDEVTAEWMLAGGELAGGETGAEFALPIDVGSWDGTSEIRAEVFLPPGADGAIRCDIDLSSRTEGFDTDDGFWFDALLGERAGNFWEGWRQFRFPSECFYVRGIPTGWQRPRSALITGPAGSRFRSVRLVSRRIADGPRLTDEALIDEIDTSSPGMAAVEAARKRGDRAAALSAFVAALRRSGRDRRAAEPAEPTAHTSEADEILAGRIMGQEWSAGIDWNANPVGYIEWSIVIHFLRYLSTLADAWRLSGDDRYALGIERIVVDWMRRNPMPVGVRAGGLAWGHSLVVAMRAFGPLLDSFDVLLRFPGTAERTIVDLAKSLWEHAEYLLAFESHPIANKGFAEGRTVAAIGCVLPELRSAGQWRTEGFGRLLGQMDAQILPDGASYELTPGYQLAIAGWLLEARQVAIRHGHPLHPRFDAGLRSMYAWATAIARPDGTRPSLSDAGSADTAYGESLAGPGRILGDAAALWVGTEGREGARPANASVALPDSGCFVMRSGWHRDAVYLLFEAGPYGRSHQHEDMLGIDLAAFGVPFIVDPGCLSYLPDAFRDYYRGTAAHNTVMVDGSPQARGTRQARTDWIRSARDSTVWRSDERSDVAVGAYDAGYAGLDGAIRHRRAVLFAKPDYVVIFDEVSGPGAHTCETLFHFMPYRVAIDRSTGAVRTVRQAAANVEIRPIGVKQVRIVCGQLDPVQGWVSLGRQDVPAPVAIYRRRAALPVRTAFVIVPFGADRVTAGIDLATVRRGDRWTVDVGLPSGRRDRIVMDWSDAGGPVLHPGRP